MKKSDSIAIWLTLIGMIGLYIGGYYAYKKYESYKTGVSSVSGAAGLLGGLLGSGN